MDAEGAVEEARHLRQFADSRAQLLDGVASEVAFDARLELRPHPAGYVSVERAAVLRIRLALLETEIGRNQLRATSARRQPVHVEDQFLRRGQSFRFVDG